MAKLKHSERRLLESALRMGSGYVLNFSDRTYAEFFEDEFGIDIDHEKYRINGDSKAKRLRTFWEVEDETTVARVLRRLWDFRGDTRPLDFPTTEYEERPSFTGKKEYFEIVSRLESESDAAQVDVLAISSESETFSKLRDAVEKELNAREFSSALDRLHTYCMKRLALLIRRHGGNVSKNDPLHSRLGSYLKLINEKVDFRPITEISIKSAISIFDKFNSIRNDQSFAHDNELVNEVEARYITDSILAILRLLKSVEGD